MWPIVIICGALNGHLDCIQMAEQTLPMTAIECYDKLDGLNTLVEEFKVRHPYTKDYVITWKGCGSVPGQET